MAKIDQVIAKYLEFRAELDAKRKQFKQDEKDLKFKMERLSMWMAGQSKGLGVNSFATDSGTAFKHTKKVVRVADWEQVLKFMLETDNLQMLEKRIGKINTLDIIDETGEIPPGVEYFEEIEFQVRKPTK